MQREGYEDELLWNARHKDGAVLEERKPGELLSPVKINILNQSIQIDIS